MNKKFLTLKNETSDKFWTSCVIPGTGKIISNYGKVDKKGTFSANDYKTEENALKHFQFSLKTKTKKGYAENSNVPSDSIYNFESSHLIEKWNAVEKNKKAKKEKKDMKTKTSQKKNTKDKKKNTEDKKKERVCGNCGKCGHNKRTCTEVDLKCKEKLNVGNYEVASEKETEIIIQFIQNEFTNDNYYYDYLRDEDYLTIGDIKQVNAGQIDIKIIVPQDYESSEMLTQATIRANYYYGDEDFACDDLPYGYFSGEKDTDQAVTGGGDDFYIKASKDLYKHIKKIKHEKDSRPEEEQELEKLDKDIAEKVLMLKNYKELIQRLEKDLVKKRKRKKNLSRILKRKSQADSYRGKAWDSAVKFVQNQLGYDEYLASAWIRPISGKVKKGESQHEWAYFEPCNRGDGGMGMSKVGTADCLYWRRNSWDNNPNLMVRQCSLTRDGILGLFHPNDKTTLRKANLCFDKMEKLQEKDDEYSYEEYEEILYDTIDMLLDSVGFEKIERE